ncbi:hypothetical protein VVR12_03145 [Rothia sp. LK2588]|uniref:hypothetical protein n=1 Tax=Rothia sp. LK2588 TaxID=3114369 RepID=UPI0034D000D6
MKKVVTITAITLAALTGCSANPPTSDTASSSSTPTPQTYKQVKNWEGSTEDGAKFTATIDVNAPAGVAEARELMGKKDKPLSFLAVTVDNINGSNSTSAYKASFTTPEGELVEYSMLSDFLNYQEPTPEPTGDAANRIIEVHNAFSGDQYQVAAGQKKTIILATENKYPAEITHATINESYALTPSEKSAETDKATGAPEPTEPVGSNDILADLNGTTLKGNDINFRIFSPNAQKEVNAAMPEQLHGSWGALCSNSATEEQLKETGASSNEHGWRPIDYAVSESGIASLSGAAQSEAYDAASLAELSHGGTCALIQSPDPAAATKTTEATVGHYLGNFSLESTVEVK